MDSRRRRRDGDEARRLLFHWLGHRCRVRYESMLLRSKVGIGSQVIPRMSMSRKREDEQNLLR